MVIKKRNWSAPSPERRVNYWWKRAHSLNEGVAECFRAISKSTACYHMWFSEEETALIPKPGGFVSENQRPITCLNTGYKWFTSCLLGPMDRHLGEYDLMERQQRGAKAGCNGTIMDNLLIDRTVTRDCNTARENGSYLQLSKYVANIIFTLIYCVVNVVKAAFSHYSGYMQSCPWIDNRVRKDEEKTLKYGPLRWELKQQYKGYTVEQHNIIIDVLGGWSCELDAVLHKLLGPKSRDVLKRMQRSFISSTLNIARTFKIVT